MCITSFLFLHYFVLCCVVCVGAGEDSEGGTRDEADHV